MLKKFENWIKNDESGQGMVEYGLIIALVAVVLIVALTALNGGLQHIFTTITNTLNPPA
jgi:pilus assembly protein Flp/PilA